MSSVQLAADRARLVRGGVQVEVEIRRIIEHCIDFVSAGMNTIGDGVVMSVEVLVVEQINPVPAVVVARGVMEMKCCHRAVEPVPRDVIAHSFFICIEIEAGNTPPVVVSAVFQLITIEPYQELFMAGVVCRGDLLR